MNAIYRSPQWKGLGPIDRAQLLLVVEGIKPGTTTRGNRTTFLDVLRQTSLDYQLVTDKYDLIPVLDVASTENLGERTRKQLEVAADADGMEFYRINGEFYGFPDCCIDEYCGMPTRGNRGLSDSDNPYAISKCDQELLEHLRQHGTYPDVFDYVPPGFGPCGIDCKAAREQLGSYKETLERLDPEAARALSQFNQNGMRRMVAADRRSTEHAGRREDYRSK